MTTDNKIYFIPRYLYFTNTVDGYTRLLAVDVNETAQSIILTNANAQGLIEALDQGKERSLKLIVDDTITIVIELTKDKDRMKQYPIDYLVLNEAPKRYKFRLAQGKISHTTMKPLG